MTVGNGKGLAIAAVMIPANGRLWLGLSHELQCVR